jgi:Recombinase-like helix-turn-helix domain
MGGIIMDYNPHLKPWQKPEPNKEAGKGKIEQPGAVDNIVWQTRAQMPSDYEFSLADTLIECFDNGIEELDALVAALNERGVLTPDGHAWTEQSFAREMERLGV